MKRIVFALATLALILTSLLAPGATASAASPKPLILQTSPLPIDLTAQPGTTVSTDIRVKQDGTDTEQLKVSLMKFRAYGDQGKPRLVDRQPGDDYFDWVKFNKTQFAAPANVWQTIHMTINLPKTAAFGYYYAVVFSRVGDDVRQSGETNAINGGSAVLVLLDALSPNAKRQLQLVSFTATHTVYEFLPVSFNIKLANTGNIHAVPQGDIFITKGSKQLAVLPVNAELGNILPGSNRIYPMDWTDGFPVYQDDTLNGKVIVDKNGNPERHLSWDWTQVPKLRMGEYTAHLEAVYNDGQRDVPLEAEVTFWVIPWRFLLALLAIIALVGFGLLASARGLWRGAKRVTGRGGRR